MRLRKPNFEFSQQEEPENKREMKCRTYEVTTITPIFGGGVEAGVPDEELPIRATAIRGQLRYWWRFLTSHRKENPITDHKELFKLERKIWGGMGEKGVDFASKVSIYISNVTVPRIEPCYEYIPNGTNEHGKPKYDEQFLHDIPSYALFSGKGKKPHERSAPEVSGDKEADVILAGLRFTLTVASLDAALLNDDWELVLESIRWWANFGGIGARTRRGLGSVAVEKIIPLTKEDVEKYDCKYKALNQTPKANSAWGKSIEKLQSFRQGKNIGRRAATDPTKPKKLGRSYWPEPDSIRLITGKNANGRHQPINTSVTFPRAAFGLPIIFDFNVRPSEGEPPKTELTPAGENRERMASPLILKAQFIGDGQFLPIALLLPTNHLDNLEVTLKYTENTAGNPLKTLSRKGVDVWWPKDETAQAEIARQIEPLKNRGCDVLTAFMNYFEEG